MPSTHRESIDNAINVLKKAGIKYYCFYKKTRVGRFFGRMNQVNFNESEAIVFNLQDYYDIMRFVSFLQAEKYDSSKEDLAYFNGIIRTGGLIVDDILADIRAERNKVYEEINKYKTSASIDALVEALNIIKYGQYSNR